MKHLSILRKFASNQQQNAVSTQTNKRTLNLLLLGTLTLAAVAPDLALAGPWDTGAAQILAIFTGGLTRTLAIIAVIACGIAAMMDKLSWDWAVKIIIGIVLIFGSAAIVDYVIAASA